jgi:hypothetical protein
MAKCKSCKKDFERKRMNQIVCSYECSISYSKELNEKKKAKEWQKEKKEIKEKLMSKSDYLNLAQKVFNTYIRLRDKDKNCISCDKPLQSKYDAGHFFSVGAYPNLRFNENNVFAQCVHCNRDKHGNVKEYDLRLQKVLSNTEYQNLLLQRNEPLKLSIDEVKDLIKLYRNKIKEL